MPKENPIRLFWWSEPYLMGKPKENYGDLLGKYLVEKISGKPVRWVHPKKFQISGLWQPVYVTAGSILAHVNKKCVVWGSGIIQINQVVKPAKFLAVRGPQTRNRLLEQGHQVPEVYGDPGLLLPLYYNPPTQKKYKLGLIAHYNDYKIIQPLYENDDDILLIDLMTNDIEATTDLFLQCEKIVSSSLHGLIIAHAYGIPALWVQFSDKLFGDGIKFQDYYESVKLPFSLPEIEPGKQSSDVFLNRFNSQPALPDPAVIARLQKGLMDVCPF
ncbi:MAG: polysaccharide pyruvyl transferase family protein [Flavobacteriaceae bacterium]|nr:polysaccharide pyruvyl transferase family protein [Flavobacteriaceae bacterium]